MKEEWVQRAKTVCLVILGMVVLLGLWSNLEEHEAQAGERLTIAEQKRQADLAYQQSLLDRAEAALAQPEPRCRFGGAQTEHLQHKTLSEGQMNADWDGTGHGARYRYDEKEIHLSKKGTDQKLHFLSSFLTGYAPFKTTETWVPHYVLSQRKSYQEDHVQYLGERDVWQTSYEAHHNPSGDCEDFAVALADWLIEMGHDARVVIGYRKEQYHVWVVLFQQGKVFLMEATCNKPRFRNLAYPNAEQATEYEPVYMFNREKFWVNTGSRKTTDYTGSRWSHRSTYRAP